MASAPRRTVAGVTFLGLPLPASSSVLRSSIDPSVNFVTTIGDGEALEARYVRRGPDYISVYVSPATACAQACRMCHLTASGQVRGRDAALTEIVDQASAVLDHYAARVASGAEEPTRVAHFNFMARGEPLASQVIIEHGAELMDALQALARTHGLRAKVKISTIGPVGMPRLLDAFPYDMPDLYYSLYSLDPAFRRRWLPKAGAPQDMLEQLVEVQRVTRKIPVLHHALIAGENDHPSVAADIIEKVNDLGLRADVNIVRYNPPSPKHGHEPSESVLELHQAMYQSAWPAATVKLVRRVGLDVAASCGMFVGGNTPAAVRPLVTTQ